VLYRFFNLYKPKTVVKMKMKLTEINELKSFKSRMIEEKTNLLFSNISSGKTDVTDIQDIQCDIKVLNGQLKILDLVMGLKS